MTHYTWNAQDYQQHSQAQQKWARELIALLDLTGSERVLDLGCGDGKVTAEIARLIPNGSIVGVDNSAQMISLAQENYAPADYPNLTFRVMDARQLDFNNEFDVIFSNAVLHWVQDHEPVVIGLYNSLKIGGKILLRMGGEGDAKDMVSAMDKVTALAQWRDYFADFQFPYTFASVEMYQHLLEKVGLHKQHIALLPRDMVHNGQHGLESWIRTTWLPYVQRVPLAQRECFIQQVAEHYLANIPLDESGQAHVAMMLIEVSAQKIR